MSLSYDLPATADAFRCGILSSKLAAIFDRTPGTGISETDLPEVLAAASLVREILNGAKTLSERNTIKGVTAEGIRSLGIALTPLRRLARLSKENSPSDETILTLLSRIHDALDQAAASAVIPKHVELATVVRDFFGFLADALLSNIGRSRDRTFPSS
jgi:antitoxin component HigA of HigAB toxin-antitoxin module